MRNKHNFKISRLTLVNKIFIDASLIAFSLMSSHLLLPTGYANIPAAYLACEDATPGEACVMTGPQYGACVLDTLCTDPEETFVNECLLCVDECWNGIEGQRCIRPWTGEEGECELQSQCTDRTETSFLECMRCVELKPPVQHIDQGCFQSFSSLSSVSSSSSSWTFFLLFGSLFLPILLIKVLRVWI